MLSMINKTTWPNQGKLIIGILLLMVFGMNLIFSQSEYVQDSRDLNPLESAANRTGDFLWSLVGAIAGFLLFFIVGPFLMFKSEFQYLLQNYSKAKTVDPKIIEDGFLAVFGRSNVKKPVMMGKTALIYELYVKEKLEVTTKVVCGSEADSPNVEKISQAPDKCRKVVVSENGRDVEKTVCEKCYNAKVKEWKEVERSLKMPEFSIEKYLIKPNEKTLFKGDIQSKEEKYKEGSNEFREKIEYIESNGQEMLAVGDSKGGEITKGNPFVVSTKNFSETREIIANEQKGWVMMLKILGFLAFGVGMYLILNPIPTLINIFGAIPLLGGIFGAFASASGFIIIVFALVSAVIMTIALTVVFKVARAVTDNILVIIGLTVIIGLILMFVLGKIV